MSDISVPNVHIGNNIKLVRTLKEMKQETLAEKLGITQAAVSKMESSSTIDEDQLDKVAEALGVSPDLIKLFSREYIINNYFQKENQQMINNQYNTLNEKVFELYDALLKEKDKRIEQLEKKDKG